MECKLSAEVQGDSRLMGEEEGRRSARSQRIGKNA